MKVLYVDDESDFLRQAKAFLENEKNQLEVETASSAKEGLKLLEENGYEAIVSDYQMPKIDGLEFLKTVREDRGSDIPFIIFTRKSSEEVAIEALNHGANRFLRKGKDPSPPYKALSQAITQEAEHYEMECTLDFTSFSLDNADEGALRISPDGKIEYANKWICKKLGYDRGEIAGMNISDIDPNYSDERPDIWNKLKEEGSTTFETEYRTKDGEILPVEITNHYVERGEGEYEFAFVHDVTDWKEAEKKLERVKDRYEELFRGSSQLVVTTDPEGYIKRVNRRTMEVSGYSEDELVGESVLKIAAPEQEDKYVEFWNKVMEEGEAKMTLKTQNKDGSNKWIRAGGRTITEDGEIVEIQYSSQDITELVRTRRREDFLHSLLRHDVRNKVQVIDGYLDILLDEEMPEEDKISYIKKVKRATGRSIDLIEKVRTLRKIQDMDIKEVNLKPLIQKVVDRRRSEASEMEFRFEMDCSDGECWIKGGPLLEELFSNLLENSIRHSEGGKLRVSNRWTNGEMVVTIEDDGRGIPEEERDKIFEKGHKGYKSGGSGLGMYLAKEIAESYGGDIEVSDSELGGAKLEVHLQRA